MKSHTHPLTSFLQTGDLIRTFPYYITSLPPTQPLRTYESLYPPSFHLPLLGDSRSILLRPFHPLQSVAGAPCFHPLRWWGRSGWKEGGYYDSFLFHFFYIIISFFFGGLFTNLSSLIVTM